MEPPTGSYMEHSQNAKNSNPLEQSPYKDVDRIDTSVSSFSLVASSDENSSAVVLSRPCISSSKHVSPSDSMELELLDTITATIVPSADPGISDDSTPDNSFRTADRSDSITFLAGENARHSSKVPFDEENEKPLQTAAEIRGAMDKGVLSSAEFAPEDRWTVHVGRGSLHQSDNKISTLNSALPSTVDNRPYPLMHRGVLSMSSSNTSNTLSELDGSSLYKSAESMESVLEVPSQAEVLEQQRTQRHEDNTRELMQTIELTVFPDEKKQFDFNQQYQDLLPPGLQAAGFQVTTFGNQPIALRDAVNNVYRPFMQGQQMFGPQQVQAQAQIQGQTQDQLQAQHNARVVNVQMEPGNRARDIRARLVGKDGKLKALQGSEQRMSEQSGAATPIATSVPGLAKGLTKQPPKPKTKAARILALRSAVKPSRVDTPVHVRSRVSSMNQDRPGRSTTPVASIATPSSGEETKTRLVPTALTFEKPRQDKSIQTYARFAANASYKELQPAAPLSSDSQSTLEEVDINGEDDGSGEAADTDDEDQSEDQKPFGVETLGSLHESISYELGVEIQARINTLIELLCSLMADLWSVHRADIMHRVCAETLDGVLSLKTSEPIEMPSETLQAQKLYQIGTLAQEIWGEDTTAFSNVIALLSDRLVVAEAESIAGDNLGASALIHIIAEYLVNAYRQRMDGSDDQAFSDVNDGDEKSETQLDDDERSTTRSVKTPSPPPDFKSNTMPLRIATRAKPDAQSHTSKHDTTKDGADAANTKKQVPKPLDSDDSWMEAVSPAVSTTKKKKNKRKKKALATKGSNVPGSTGYFNLQKVTTDDKARPSTSNPLKASNSMVSHPGSDVSGVELAVKTPFATHNIFDQLKRADLGETQSTSPDKQKAQEEEPVEVIAVTSMVDEKHPTGTFSPSDQAEKAEGQTEQDQSFAKWTDAEPIGSWADSDAPSPVPEPKLAPEEYAPLVNAVSTAKPVEAELNSQPASRGTGSGRHFFPKRRFFFHKRFGGAHHHDQRRPSQNASSEEKTDNAQSPAQDKISTEEKDVNSQTPTPGKVFNRRLSQRDINDGATIEPHPVNGKECCILREPIERPDYECTLFAAGIPYYNESVINWQQLRMFIITHFKKFGDVVKLKAVKDSNSSGHVNAFITFSNRQSVEESLGNPQSRILTVPAIPNSYDHSREQLKVLAKKEINGNPWMDIPIRLEKAQGIRRVYLHITGLRQEEATKRGVNTLPRWQLPVPHAVTFESYLDPFGVDSCGREKFRLRKRLRITTPPYELEQYRRRNQILYPGEAPVTVHFDAADSEEEYLRRLCAVFGELECLRPWSDKGTYGFEAIFYDRECAIRALNQIRMISGMSAFWSHEKHGPKPAPQVSSLLQLLVSNAASNAKVEAPSTASLEAIPLKGSPATAIASSIKQEWPDLPTSNNKKKCIELPEEGSPPPLALPELPHLPSVEFDRASEEEKREGASHEITSSVLGISAEGLDVNKADISAAPVPHGTAPVSRKDDDLSKKGESVEKSTAVAAKPELKDLDTISLQRTAGYLDDDKADIDVQAGVVQEAVAAAIATVATLNVRLSPAPSTDERMTIIVDGLSKDEPEEAIKERFKAYGRIVKVHYKQGPKHRRSMSLSYNSIHSARQAVEAENGKIVFNRKQRVRLGQIGNTANQHRKFRSPLIVAIPPVQALPSRVPLSNAVPALGQDVYLKREIVEHSRQEESSLLLDTPSGGTLRGRKRAFSDPGEVKRPSTASTDLPEDHIIPVPLPTSERAPESQDLHFNQRGQHGPHQNLPLEQHAHEPRTRPSPQQLYMSSPAPGGFVPMHHEIEHGMGYQGYGYPMYVQPGMLQYYSYPQVMEMPIVPLPPAWDAAMGSYSLENVAMPVADNNAHDGVANLGHREDRTVYPKVNTLPSAGLTPVNFTQTEYGLMPIYDPQELSRYRREHGLLSDDGPSRSEPAKEPPLTLLPVSSGGHSPTRLSFGYDTAEPYRALSNVDEGGSSSKFDRLPFQHELESPRTMVESRSETHSPGTRNPNLYPLYLRDTNGESAQIEQVQAFQAHNGEPMVHQAYANQGIPPAALSAYAVAPMFAVDTSMMPAASSVHRAPMQLHSQVQAPTAEYRLAPEQAGYMAPNYFLNPHHNAPILRNHQQREATKPPRDDRTTPPPPGFAPGEMMMYNVPPHLHGVSPSVQPLVFGHPSNTSPKRPRVSTTPMILPEMMNRPPVVHASPRSVYPQRSGNVGHYANARDPPHARSQSNQAPTAYSQLGSNRHSSSGSGYRQPLMALPMQSVAFQAARGAPRPGPYVNRGRGKNSGAGRKPSAGARGPRLPPQGVHPA